MKNKLIEVLGLTAVLLGFLVAVLFFSETGIQSSEVMEGEEI